MMKEQKFNDLVKEVRKIKDVRSSRHSAQDFSSIFFNGKNLSHKIHNEYTSTRSYWIKPEYDFGEISIAYDVEGYFRQAIQKKVNKIISAGNSFVSQNKDALRWVEKRVKELSIATDKPWNILIAEIFTDMFKYYNCMLIKVRNSDFGSGEELKFGKVKKQTIAGYYLLRLDRCEFKINKNGTLKTILQKGTSSADNIEFSAKDIVHFYSNKRAGFLMGTPEVVPILDDMRLLRRLEENVVDLIETNLFPVFHYKIGSDKFPERMTEGGVTESEKISSKIKYMASSGFIVSDHRHEVTAVGSESKALRIDYYLEYFRGRVLTGLAVSPIDLGMGDTANRSTASSMSKAMLADVEAMALQVKYFIDHFIIAELLEEGGFDSFDPENRVEIRFGTIDKEERRADENQVVQNFSNNIITLDEARSQLQLEPYTDKHYERSHMNMFQIPVIEAEASAQAEAGVAIAKVRGVQSSSNKSVANKTKPSNQHGTRSGPKTRKDMLAVEILGKIISITCDFEIEPDKVEDWKDYVINMYNYYNGTFSIESIANTTLWRLNGSRN